MKFHSFVLVFVLAFVSVAYADITEKFTTTEDEFTGVVRYIHKDNYLMSDCAPAVLDSSQRVEFGFWLQATSDEGIYADTVYIRADDETFLIPYNALTAIGDADIELESSVYVVEKYLIRYNRDTLPTTVLDIVEYPFISAEVLDAMRDCEELKFRLGPSYVIELTEEELEIIHDCVELYYYLMEEHDD